MEALPQIHANPHAQGRKYSKFFKALADPTRREILRMLDVREFTVGEIVGRFHLSQPTISRHLSVLKEAELVHDRRQGQHVWYRLDREVLADSVRGFFGEFSRCRLFPSSLADSGFRGSTALRPGGLARPPQS